MANYIVIEPFHDKRMGRGRLVAKGEDYPPKNCKVPTGWLEALASGNFTGITGKADCRDGVKYIQQVRPADEAPMPTAAELKAELAGTEAPAKAEAAEPVVPDNSGAVTPTVPGADMMAKDEAYITALQTLAAQFNVQGYAIMKKPDTLIDRIQIAMVASGKTPEEVTAAIEACKPE